MHLHNVAFYAPPGYRLERSDMANGQCTHTFVREDGRSPLGVTGSWATAEEERAALERFRKLHALRAELDVGVASPVADNYSLNGVLAKVEAENARLRAELPSENLVSEAAVRAVSDAYTLGDYQASVDARAKGKAAPKGKRS